LLDKKKLRDWVRGDLAENEQLIGRDLEETRDANYEGEIKNRGGFSLIFVTQSSQPNELRLKLTRTKEIWVKNACGGGVVGGGGGAQTVWGTTWLKNRNDASPRCTRSRR